jgi:hypothetical protein
LDKNSKLDSGPQVSRPSSLFTVVVGHRPACARYAAGHHAVTTLTSVRTPALVAAGHRRPTWVSWPYPLCACIHEKSSTILPPPHAHSHSHSLLPLPPCFLSPMPLLPIVGHHRLLPLLSTLAETSASTSSMVDTNREPEPTAALPLRAIVFTIIFLHTPRRHRRPSNLLRPSQRLEELCTTSLSIFDPTFTAGDLMSEPPLSSTPPPSTAPSLVFLGEPSVTVYPGLGSPSPGLAPRFLLPRQLIADQPKSANKAPAC